MRARPLVLMCTTAAAALALTTVPASATGSHPCTWHRLHGTTAVTVSPAITRALLGRGILPVVTAPGRAQAVAVGGRQTLRALYPVTGGTLSLKPLGGTITHTGGLEFVNTVNDTHLGVDSFTIDLTHAQVTAHVTGTRLRIPLFTLDLSHAKVHTTKHTLVAEGIGLNLTRTAADALDATLHTTVFTPGLAVGTAATHDARY